MKSVGNWTRGYYYDPATNRLLNHDNGTSVYDYDAHGNLIQMPHLPIMEWDYRDQLKEVQLNLDGDKAYYVYDSSGERVRKVIEKGHVKEERIYLGGYEVYHKTSSLGTDDIERTSLFITDGNKTIAQIDTLDEKNTIRYQYDNHLGSASLELNDDGGFISYEEYHPFGTTSYRSGKNSAEVSLKRYKYVGKERDEETGLYYYGARYYSAWLARFISVDPLQHKYPYYTPYQYAGNKPITYFDLDGLKEKKPNNGLSETTRLYGRYMQGYFSGMTNSAKFYKKLISDPEGTLTATAEALDNGVQALGLMMDGATIQEMQAYDKANGTNTEAYGKVFDQVIKDFVKASINAGKGDYGDVAEFLGKSAWEVTEAILFSKGAGMLSKSKVAAEVASGLDDVGDFKKIKNISSKNIVGNVGEFIESQQKNINKKLGGKIGRFELPFELGKEGLEEAVQMIKKTLENPSEITSVIPRSKVQGNFDLIHVYNKETDFTVSLRVLGDDKYGFDTMIKGRSSKFDYYEKR